MRKTITPFNSLREVTIWITFVSFREMDRRRGELADLNLRGIGGEEGTCLRENLPDFWCGGRSARHQNRIQKFALRSGEISKNTYDRNDHGKFDEKWRLEEGTIIDEAKTYK
jgi:hypothetical protein